MEETMDQSERFAAELLAGGFTCPPPRPPSLAPCYAARSSSHPAHALPRVRLAPASAKGARARASASDDAVLHPALRLGWQRLCGVVCNGLSGDLLGGHDRDVWIRATSGPYASLPLVDFALGGCIMLGSQFERAAGRELSKKWKESIHVVGEGEGSRSTLLSWLRRRAEADFGAAVVGRKIWVCWCARGEYVLGSITSFSPESGKHSVQYGARLTEELHLPLELLSFDAAKPPAAPPPLAAASAPAASGGGEPVASWSHPELPAASGVAALHQERAVPTRSPLRHQGSDASVRSTFSEELPPVLLPAGQSTAPPPSRAPVAAEEAQPLSPRRPRKAPRRMDGGDYAGPAACGAAAASSSELLPAGGPHAAAGQEEVGVPGAWPLHGVHSGVPSPITPGPPRRQTAGAPGAAAAAELPEPPGVLGQPPDEAQLAAAVAWMHSVALVLEQDLLEAAAAAPCGELPRGLSPSARFQSVLALARGDAARVQGLCEAMAARYCHYAAAGPPLLRRRMAEFVVAVLQHDAAAAEAAATAAATLRQEVLSCDAAAAAVALLAADSSGR